MQFTYMHMFYVNRFAVNTLSHKMTAIKYGLHIFIARRVTPALIKLYLHILAVNNDHVTCRPQINVVKILLANSNAQKL